MDASIKTGETISEDWGTFSERDGRLGRECEKRVRPFYPEDDYIMRERQEDDKARALAMASKRKGLPRTGRQNETKRRTLGPK